MTSRVMLGSYKRPAVIDDIGPEMMPQDDPEVPRYMAVFPASREAVPVVRRFVHAIAEIRDARADEAAYAYRLDVIAALAGRFGHYGTASGTAALWADMIAYQR